MNYILLEVVPTVHIIVVGNPPSGSEHGTREHATHKATS